MTEQIPFILLFTVILCFGFILYFLKSISLIDFYGCFHLASILVFFVYYAITFFTEANKYNLAIDFIFATLSLITYIVYETYIDVEEYIGFFEVIVEGTDLDGKLNILITDEKGNEFEFSDRKKIFPYIKNNQKLYCELVSYGKQDHPYVRCLKLDNVFVNMSGKQI